MKEAAKDHFLGKNGKRRLNCAQAVAETFRGKFPLEERAFTRLSLCGNGMAPLGLCGAFYAAKNIIELYLPDQLEKKLGELHDAAGSLKCREIKSLKRISCLGCVEKAAETIEGTCG